MRRIIVLLAVLAIAAPGAAPAEPDPAIRPFAPLEDMFHAYGDAGAAWEPGEARHWTGGDSTYSVPLPDGRTAWLFSDTFLAPTNGCYDPEDPSVCHARRRNAPLVNNTFVVQDGHALTTTLFGGSHDLPTALIRPELLHDRRSFYWMGDGVVEDDELHVFVRRFPWIGVLPPTAEAIDIATFRLPELTLDRITPGVGSDGVRPWGFVTPPIGAAVPITWGAALLEDEDHVYVYGTEEYPAHKHLHVARAPRGDLLDGPWQFWTGTEWSNDRLGSARVLSNVAGEMSVVRTSAGYRLITSELGIGAIVMYTAPSPAGPWDQRRVLYQPPESARGAWAYNAHEHRQYSTDDTVVLSYNVNGTLDGHDIYSDVHIYRPRFIEVTL